MPMRTKTTLLIILIIFVATAATFFSGLYFTNESLKKTMEQDLAFAIGIADSLVSTQMKLMKTEAATVAGRLSAANNQEELAELLAEQFNDYPDISALSVFDKDGVIANYSVPPHIHDMADYGELRLVRDGKTVISSPFYCSTEGEFVMNVYTSMTSGRILSATMPGLRFSDMLAKHRLWQTGNIFMLDEAGTFIGAADKELVLTKRNYITDSEENQDLTGEGGAGSEIMAGLIRKILSEDSGVESYRFEGLDRLCAYTRIEGSLLGWRVAVTVPFEESPQAEALKGHIYSAAFFLISGTGAAFFLSRLTDRPFKKIEAQNRDLEKLNRTIRSQAAAILEEHERVKLMLDATPLASRLWTRDFKLLECNEEAVKLFKLKSKQEYLDRYYELAPELQPDGRPTREKIREVVTEAFEKGEAVYEWMYRLPDGTPVPAEIRLVRVPYEDDYVVAGYSRDLREHKKMMADIEHRDNLLALSNRTASILFDSAESENIEAVLLESMETLGRSVGADRVHLMRNEMIGGELHFTCKYAWIGDSQATGKAIEPGMSFPYGIDPNWKDDFEQGKCLNGPVESLPDSAREFFASFGIKSILVIPIVVQGQFWGRIGYSDCGRERFFDEEEVNILRSSSLLMAAAINRSAQAAGLREAHKRVRLLTNATPLGFNLWDKNFNNIDTNDTAVNLFGLSSQREYLERFFELSPEYQPDGQISREKTIALLKEAFNTGWSQFDWLHQTLDGTPVPSEVTLVRLAYGDDYVIAGYIRDIREYRKMLTEIEQRDHLLQTVNQAADTLLRAEPDDFSDTLSQCMGMMADAIDADRMYLFKNREENGRLYFSRIYEWSKDALQSGDSQGAALTGGLEYDRQTPELREQLLRGECVHSLVRDLPPAGRELFGSQGALSVLVVPVFIRNEFWGFVGFDNCHGEHLFTENEESVTHSGSLLIVNALLRNEYMLSIRDASAKLEAALGEAEDANNAKSDFLASMSHEMRTPLNAIIGLSEVAVDNDELDQDTKSYLEKIYNSGSTLLSIVNDILDISKIQAGKFVIVPNPYDVPSMVNDAVLQNVLRIGSKPIRFILGIDENMPARLCGDELRIKQIINNLLSNAIKYTDEGTVELSLSFGYGGGADDEGTVWLTIRVSDTGVGMKPEHLEHLFTDYSQFGSTTKYRAGGTGLGLVITKSLAEMMDGGVAVESSYGEGSTFTARLRQRYVNDAVIGAAVAESLKNFQYSTNKLNRHSHLNRIRLPYASVLVVDDNVTNLDVARGLMKPYGMRVDCVISGAGAVRAIREEKVLYNAIFMDHMMPEMDGIEATRVIREEIGTEYARTVPIIALTANAIAGNEEMFLRSGFQGFISKPIELARLDDMIRRFVRDQKQEELLGLIEDSPAGDDEAGLSGELDEGGAELLTYAQDIEGLDAAQGLGRYGSEASYTQILRSYAINTRAILDAVREVGTDTLEDYSIAVHGLKGASRNICAEPVGALAEELERASKDGDFDFVTRSNPAFIEIVQKLVADIEAALDNMAKAHPRPQKERLDDGDLLRLYEACENYDFTAIDAVVEAIENYEYTSDGGLAAWLLENITQMNFARIMEKLSSLVKRLGE